jgi:hypothetical protein
MENDESFIVRVGTFFLVMGGGALVLFVVSDLAGDVNFDYLFIAVLLIGIGWMLRRNRAPRPPAGRFSGIRGILGGRRGKGQPPQKEK